MPIVEGPPCEFSENEYVTDAIAHEEGILTATSGAEVTYSFEWHEYPEQSGGTPWPFLEIRKVLVDDRGTAHACSSFVEGCEVIGGLSGRSVLSQKAFLSRFNDTDVRPLTGSTTIYCDSREMLLFQYHEEERTGTGRIVAHFEKHFGADIRLLRAMSWVVLEMQNAYFDDRVSGEHLDLKHPVFAEIDLDLWRNTYHARTADEFRAWHSPNLVEPTFNAPIVFRQIDGTHEPDPNIRFLPEPWTPKRARELIDEGIQRYLD